MTLWGRGNDVLRLRRWFGRVPALTNR